MIYRSSGPSSVVGCGLALACLGLFLLTPLGLFFIKGIAWSLVTVGVLVAALGVWAWLRRNQR